MEASDRPPRRRAPGAPEGLEIGLWIAPSVPRGAEGRPFDLLVTDRMMPGVSTTEPPGAPVALELRDGPRRVRVFAALGPDHRMRDPGAAASPQPGFAPTATGAEEPVFDWAAVLRIEVELGRSGALDALRWDPHPGSRAGAKRAAH